MSIKEERKIEKKKVEKKNIEKKKVVKNVVKKEIDVPTLEEIMLALSKLKTINK